MRRFRAVLLMLVGSCSASQEVLAPEPAPSASRADPLWANVGQLWTGAPPLIPVCYEPSVPTTGLRRSQVRNHAEQWQRFARINFTQWDNCVTGEPGIHLAMFDIPGPNAPGSSAIPVGKGGVNGKDAGINLNSADDNPPSGTRFRNVVTHEFGHALGLFHEEERTDYTPSGNRNNNTVDDVNEPACQRGTFVNTQPRFFGSFDIDSVMSQCGSVCFTPGCAETNSELSPNDIASIQTLYGRRISGSLVTPQGDCAASPANDSNRDVTVYDCDESEDDQEFVFTPSAGTLHIRSGIPARPNWCMESVPYGSAANVELYPACDGYSGQEWRFDAVELRGFGGLCMDLEGGNTNGGLVRVVKCDNGVNQKWTITRQSEIKFGAGSSTKCLDVNASGRFIVTACSGATAQKFNFGNNRITRQSNGQCVDVQSQFTSVYAPTDGGPASTCPTTTPRCSSSPASPGKSTRTGTRRDGCCMCSPAPASSGPATRPWWRGRTCGGPPALGCLRRSGTSTSDAASERVVHA